ncbi:type II secretion system protein GspM [Pseudoduganella aquatica]|uniref:type II secretion system protein GspM n=1 Tax=Pseudoduganella aquatica TaxID=2660641 RepID=UPI001E5EFBD9|nr:type II secretion system protein M [Pseudoduganella aquatica]
MSAAMTKIQQLRDSASAFWNERSEQERRMLTIGGAVVGLALAYSLLVAPALHGREALRKALPQLRQDVAELKALARTAAELAAKPPVQAPPMSRDALTASLNAAGLKPQSLNLTGEYAKLELKGVAFAALVTWLDAQRRDSAVMVQEAVVTGQATPGVVDAAITLRQAGGGR